MGCLITSTDSFSKQSHLPVWRSAHGHSFLPALHQHYSTLFGLSSGYSLLTRPSRSSLDTQCCPMLELGLHVVVRGSTLTEPTHRPCTVASICARCFTTGDPGKEHATNKPPPMGRVWERSKGNATCPTTSQNPRWHPSWLINVCTTRKDRARMTARDNLETNPITIKPKTEPHGRAVLRGSLTLLLSTWAPLPNSLLLCQHMCLL